MDTAEAQDGPRRKWPGLLAAALGIAAGVAALALATRRGGNAQQRHQKQMKAMGAAGRVLRALRQSLVGRNKDHIVARLGPPRATAGSASGDYLGADTWYYPLDVPRRLAIGVVFAAGAVRRIDLVAGPPT